MLSTRKAAATASAGPPAVSPGSPSRVPGAIAPTGSQTNVTQAIWSNLTPMQGPSSGYVNFPSGSQAASALQQWATDDSGNWYTQWSGQIYLVDWVPDPDGNYDARLLGS